MHHISELRMSLVICVTTLVVASITAYAFFDKILALFQKPINQTLYYTNPTGGFTFIVKLCLTVGLVVSVPVLVNRIFNFTKPAVSSSLHRSFAWYSFFSIILAAVGVTFAYIVSLPSALHFLTTFNSGDVQAMITVDSYFTFFSTYLVGYAILFQTPIVMLFINKVKPLDPGSTMKYQRHVVGGSFIVAALLTPTPDPWNQTLMALPIILLYQLGIVLVWAVNRNRVVLPAYSLSGVPLVARIPEHLQGDMYKRMAPATNTVAVESQPVLEVTLPAATLNTTQQILDVTPQHHARVFDILRVPKLAE